VAKIINFNFDERFDFAMIVHYKDPENGTQTTRWEKLYYELKPEPLPKVPLFEKPDQR
jgi:hypothetical protein